MQLRPDACKEALNASLTEFICHMRSGVTAYLRSLANERQKYTDVLKMDRAGHAMILGPTITGKSESIYAFVNMCICFQLCSSFTSHWYLVYLW